MSLRPPPLPPFLLPPLSPPRSHFADKFAGYLNRMKMPVVGSGPNAPFYYSFDYGPVHFLSYSSEHDFGEGSEQWKFMQGDLAKAAAPAARKYAESTSRFELWTGCVP